ncbi:MAG: tRNA nucleotidyltransferase, partial [Proteobacteria bacterium]
AVGDPAARFEEDPLRILRMVRFGPASGRDVEEDTLRAARSLAGKLKSVSAERVQLELRKIVSSPHAAQALRFMANHSLLPNTLPELLPCIGFEQNRYHTQDVFEHTLSVLENCAREGLLRWVALFHDVRKPESLSVGEDGERHFYEHEFISERECKRALKRLRFSNEDQEAVALLVRTHMRPLECGPPGVRRLMRDLGELFETWRAFKIADASPTMPKSEFDERLGRFDELVAKERERLERENAPGLAIGGDDLINLGLKPGPIMGKILKALEEAVLDEPALNERPILIERAKQLIQTHASS